MKRFAFCLAIIMTVPTFIACSDDNDYRPQGATHYPPK